MKKKLPSKFLKQKYALNSLDTLQPQESRLFFGTWNRVGSLGRNRLHRPLK